MERRKTREKKQEKARPIIENVTRQTDTLSHGVVVRQTVIAAPLDVHRRQIQTVVTANRKQHIAHVINHLKMPCTNTY